MYSSFIVVDAGSRVNLILMIEASIIGVLIECVHVGVIWKVHISLVPNPIVQYRVRYRPPSSVVTSE